MRYPEAARMVLSQAAQQGRATFPVGQLIAARALDMLLPDHLTAVNGDFRFDGAFVTPAKVRDVLNVPGIRVRQPTIGADASGVVDTNGPPSRVLAAFTVDDLVVDVGYGNGAVSAALVRLYRGKLKPANLLPADDVEKVARLCEVGMVAFPARASLLAGAGYPTALQVPDLAGDDLARWQAIVAAFADAIHAYDAKNLGDAAAAVDAANARADLWAAAQAVAEAVRDAPLTAVEYAGKGLGFVIGSNLTTFALIGVAVLIYLNRGAILAAAAKSARGAVARA